MAHYGLCLFKFSDDMFFCLSSLLSFICFLYQFDILYKHASKVLMNIIE